MESGARPAEEVVSIQQYQSEQEEMMLAPNTDLDMPAAPVSMFPTQELRTGSLSDYDVDESPRSYTLQGRLSQDSQNNDGRIWGRPTVLQPNLIIPNPPTLDHHAELDYGFSNSFLSNASSGISGSSFETWPQTPESSNLFSNSIPFWLNSTPQVSQSFRTSDNNVIAGDVTAGFLTTPRYVLPPHSIDLQVLTKGMPPPMDSPFDYTSPTSEMMSINASTPLGNDERQTRDEFLIQSRQKNMSYKEIKEKGGFEQSISTLRGRFRNLTKDKKDRLRKPKWTAADVSAMKASGY
jgi:hypothetical protein